MGAVGGEFSLRVPNQSIALMTLDPPRIEMGCGGIDMFGGSFSFVNSDQLVAILRNIGQVAVAALFKMAINSISKELGMSMTDMSNVMHTLNNARLNSCKIGTKIAENIWDAGKNALSNAATDADGSIKQGTGQTANSWEWDWKGIFGVDFGKIGSNAQNPNAANLTMRAVQQNQSYGRVGGLDATTVANLIMNIGGTEIVVTQDVASTGTCAANYNPTGGAVGNVCARTEKKAPTLLTVKMLLKPTPDDQVNWCTDLVIGDEFSCQNYSLQKLTNYFPGATVLAQQILFGKASDSEASPASAPSGGIVGFIETGSWGTFPGAQQYLSVISTPMLRQLVTLQRDTNAVRAVAGTAFVNVLATDITLAFADALADAAAGTFNGLKTVSEPKEFSQNVKAFRTNIAEYRQKESADIQQQMALLQYSSKVAASLGSGSIGVPDKRR